MVKWIEWSGGLCPVKDGVAVEIKFRSGNTKTTVGDRMSGLWHHSTYCETPWDVVAYQLLEPKVKASLKAVAGLLPEGVRYTPWAPDNDNRSHASALNLFAADCHAASRRGGWYTDPATGKALERNVPEMLCLIHSEISEAMEGYRKGLMDDKLPHRKMTEVELADAAIRIGDLATYLGLDLGGAVVEKMAFNASREDHKLENRKAAGGKAF